MFDWLKSKLMSKQSASSASKKASKTSKKSSKSTSSRKKKGGATSPDKNAFSAQGEYTVRKDVVPALDKLPEIMLPKQTTPGMKADSTTLAVSPLDTMLAKQTGGAKAKRTRRSRGTGTRRVRGGNGTLIDTQGNIVPDTWSADNCSSAAFLSEQDNKVTAKVGGGVFDNAFNKGPFMSKFLSIVNSKPSSKGKGKRKVKGGAEVSTEEDESAKAIRSVADLKLNKAQSPLEKAKELPLTAYYDSEFAKNVNPIVVTDNRYLMPPMMGGAKQKHHVRVSRLKSKKYTRDSW